MPVTTDDMRSSQGPEGGGARPRTACCPPGGAASDGRVGGPGRAVWLRPTTRRSSPSCCPPQGGATIARFASCAPRLTAHESPSCPAHATEGGLFALGRLVDAATNLPQEAAFVPQGTRTGYQPV